MDSFSGQCTRNDRMPSGIAPPFVLVQPVCKHRQAVELSGWVQDPGAKGPIEERNILMPRLQQDGKIAIAFCKTINRESLNNLRGWNEGGG